jgi:hypothetical protein
LSEQLCVNPQSSEGASPDALNFSAALKSHPLITPLGRRGEVPRDACTVRLASD